MEYLAVKDFAKFQHYSKRNPPWIKLYGALLTDVGFLQMPEAAQAQLMKLWLLASQFGNPLPNDPRLLAGKIGATGKFHLASIVAAGFLIPCDDFASSLASTPLASALPNASASVPASARSRERAELELETKTPRYEPPPREGDAERLERATGRLAEACGDGWSAVDAFLKRRPVSTWLGWIDAMETNAGPGSQYDVTDLVNVCRDDAALRNPIGSPTGLRAFLGRARTERIGASVPQPLAKPGRTTVGAGIGQRAHDTALNAIRDL